MLLTLDLFYQCIKLLPCEALPSESPEDKGEFGDELVILQRCPDAQLADAEWGWPRAAMLARLGRERFQQGQRDDPATLVPLYLYPQDCQVRSPTRTTSVLPHAAL